MLPASPTIEYWGDKVRALVISGASVAESCGGCPSLASERLARAPSLEIHDCKKDDDQNCEPKVVKSEGFTCFGSLLYDLPGVGKETQRMGSLARPLGKKFLYIKHGGRKVSKGLKAFSQTGAVTLDEREAPSTRASAECRRKRQWHINNFRSFTSKSQGAESY